MFEYDCPNCGNELKGSFGDDVHCENCDKTFETDWDNPSEDSYAAWITREKILDDADKHMNEHLRRMSMNQFRDTTEHVITLCFPDIEDLKVVIVDTSLAISFKEGKYSKEEVENKLAEIKNEFQSIKEPKEVVKTKFGFVIKT